MLIRKIRKPAVAGRFYPLGEKELGELIKEIHQKEQAKFDINYYGKDFYGAVVPHAGYIYSAYQAVHFFDLLRNSQTPFDTFIIINPNHTGYGEKISLDSHQEWQTPLGNIKQDMDLIREIDLPFSDIANEQEHSGEVMLPFLQYFVPYEFKIVVITLSQQNPEQARILASKINHASKKLMRKIAIIASSDFTHFKNAKQGFILDELVLEQIKNQDIDKLYQTVKDHDISVCGYGPIMCLMEYASLQGNFESSILSRGHSGQIIPSEKVVDYISILFYKS
jgi:MEMO1 family protein